MRRWVAQDRDGRTVYLTEERWRHITDRHDELTEGDEIVPNNFVVSSWGIREVS
ncbi:MAG: hypothetical protein ACE5LU_14435 [Anaerolineae bacterium]